MPRIRVALAALAVAGVALGTAVAQQPVKVPTVGVVLNASTSRNLPDLRQGLRELGHVEGQTLALHVVAVDGKLDRLPALLADLVNAQVDVIVVSGPAAVAAARRATSTIPIVMGRMDDVDVHGFVTHLAHPGGNITGLSFQTGELAGKWVHLLKETLPALVRIGLMWDATGTAHQRRTAHDAARALGLQVHVLDVRDARELDAAFARARAARVEALVILAAPMLTGSERRLAELAMQHRLPAIYYSRGFAESGGLLSYGPNIDHFSWRRAAVFVDKILKGARAADLPIEQPTTFELVVNARTARMLGVAVPPALRLRANEVVE